MSKASPRLSDHAQGRRDILAIPPQLIKIRPDFNVRDWNDPENIAHVKQLMESIIQYGVRTPLVVSYESGTIWLVGGECRLRAVFQAIELGHEINTVPVYSEQSKGLSPEDQIALLDVDNFSKRFSPLERAALAARYFRRGFTAADIARRLVCEPAYVEQLLTLNSAPEHVKKHIAAKKIASSSVVNTLRHHDPETTTQIIEESVQLAEKQGKQRATPKVVREATQNITGIQQRHFTQQDGAYLLDALHRIAELAPEGEIATIARAALVRFGESEKEEGQAGRLSRPTISETNRPTMESQCARRAPRDRRPHTSLAVNALGLRAVRSVGAPTFDHETTPSRGEFPP